MWIFNSSKYVYKYFYITVVLKNNDKLFGDDFPILKIYLWKNKAIVKTGYTSKHKYLYLFYTYDYFLNIM